MELVAHSEATVARLTSSKTKAMSETLYRLQGNPAEQQWQQVMVEQTVKSRDEVENEYKAKELSEDGVELFNMANLSMKVTEVSRRSGGV